MKKSKKWKGFVNAIDAERKKDGLPTLDDRMKYSGGKCPPKKFGVTFHIRKWDRFGKAARDGFLKNVDGLGWGLGWDKLSPNDRRTWIEVAKAVVKVIED